MSGSVLANWVDVRVTKARGRRRSSTTIDSLAAPSGTAKGSNGAVTPFSGASLRYPAVERNAILNHLAETYSDHASPHQRPASNSPQVEEARR
jgi:hypothetical protein